ncbi:RING finger protein 215-like [Patiria miniata]|uniref:RING-type domain-containing protein n=1 Tax=Patiria miniata TaxID=46514 RepID=A0A914A2U0_PATMI|nr:RING finger protein 215-like [Patiria miniata]
MYLAFLFTIFVQVVAGESGAVVLMQKGHESAVEIRGRFAHIGGAVSVVGDIRMLPRNCTKSTQPLSGITVVKEEWIGLIYLPSVEETIKEQTSSKPTTCSLLDQVKNAMLFGASALIVLAMNPALLKELDVQQLFKQPVVIIQEAVGISKVQKAVQGKSAVSVKISEVTKPQSFYWSTARLTLWSTCGRSNGGTYKEWEGVVCLGSGHGHSKIFPSFWTTLLSVIGTVCLVFVLHGKWITWGEREFSEDVESCLQRLAKSSLSKMPARKYKRKRYVLSRDKECCAICLEEFIPGKMIRILPCYHQFHCKCVDFWLINKRTCPLCKMNIVDRLTKASTGSLRL